MNKYIIVSRIYGWGKWKEDYHATKGMRILFARKKGREILKRLRERNRYVDYKLIKAE